MARIDKSRRVVLVNAVNPNTSILELFNNKNNSQAVSIEK